MAKYQYWISEEGLKKIELWARDGLVDEQIAHNMGISKATLYEWKNKFPDISDTLKKSKEVVDLEVENSLLKRALGYDFEEEVKERYVDQQGKDHGLITTKVTRKHVLPDVTAQIYWLKNRMPDKWRDKQEISANVDQKLSISVNIDED